MALKLYSYEPGTGEYTREFLARIDAPESLKCGQPRYLIPAHATAEKPPAHGEKEAVVFQNGAWCLLPDHRGECWFEPQSRSAVMVKIIGDPAVFGLVKELQKVWADVCKAAHQALFSSDRVVLRCYEDQVPVPVEWREYRSALRAITDAETGDPETLLPTPPEYPKGT